MTRSTTQRARYVFAVKEFGDGTPWIVLERSGKGLDVLENGVFGFELKEGTSLQEAETLARLIDRSVTNVSYTSFA